MQKKNSNANNPLDFIVTHRTVTDHIKSALPFLHAFMRESFLRFTDAAWTCQCCEKSADVWAKGPRSEAMGQDDGKRRETTRRDWRTRGSAGRGLAWCTPGEAAEGSGRRQENKEQSSVWACDRTRGRGEAAADWKLVAMADEANRNEEAKEIRSALRPRLDVVESAMARNATDGTRWLERDKAKLGADSASSHKARNRLWSKATESGVADSCRTNNKNDRNRNRDGGRYLPKAKRSEAREEGKGRGERGEEEEEEIEGGGA